MSDSDKKVLLTIGLALLTLVGYFIFVATWNRHGGQAEPPVFTAPVESNGELK